MSRSFEVARIVAWRTLHHFFKNPAFLIPSIIFPLFFFVAFAGGLSSVGDVPGFDYEPGYTAFQFGFVLLQASAFGGVFTGFAIAADFESGFSRRFMLGAPNRVAIVVGYAMAAMARALFIGTLLFFVALASGMNVLGGPLDIGGLVLLALLVSLTATLFSCGVAMRLRTIQAGPAMQLPAFLSLFLAPVFVPVDLLAGWVKTVAKINPITALLGGSRDLIAGTDVDVLLVSGVLAGGVLVFGLWAITGLRSAEAAGG